MAVQPNVSESGSTSLEQELLIIFEALSLACHQNRLDLAA